MNILRNVLTIGLLLLIAAGAWWGHLEYTTKQSVQVQLIHTRQTIKNDVMDGRIIEGPQVINGKIGIVSIIETRNGQNTINTYGAIVSLDQEWIVGEPVTSTITETYGNNEMPTRPIRVAYKKQ